MFVYEKLAVKSYNFHIPSKVQNFITDKLSSHMTTERNVIREAIMPRCQRIKIKFFGCCQPSLADPGVGAPPPCTTYRPRVAERVIIGSWIKT
jgi:hypothetical protein